jgi:hypothetical protein
MVGWELERNVNLWNRATVLPKEALMTGILAKRAKIAGGEVWQPAGKFRSLVQALQPLDPSAGAKFRSVELLYHYYKKKAKNSGFP